MRRSGNLSFFTPTSWLATVALLLEIVGFYNSHAGDIVGVTHNRRVIARRGDSEERRFLIVRRREPVIDNGLLVRAIHPVVIRGHERAITAAQLDRRIGQGVRYAK